MKKLGNRIWPLIFFSLAANVGNIIFFPVMFYSSFQTVFDLTNAQMGNLSGICKPCCSRLSDQWMGSR